MSLKLKPLLLPQLVQERRKPDANVNTYGCTSADATFDALPYTYHTTNSSASDLTSPVTPTFSTRGHVRYSSSSSSLDLPPLSQDSPSSPLVHAISNTTKSGKRALPDVLEEPVEREDDTYARLDSLGFHGCLCQSQRPCPHRVSSDDAATAELLSGDGYELDYDIGFLSDGDWSADYRYPKKKRSAADSPLAGLSDKLGSGFSTIRRWRSNRRGKLPTSPPNELSLDNVLSQQPSSRSSSISASRMTASGRGVDSSIGICHSAMTSFYESAEDDDTLQSIDISIEERSSLERDREMATTPLLPPLLTGPLGKPPPDSPLQSPTVEPSRAATELPSPQPSLSHFPRPSLSTRPSYSSLRMPPNNSVDLPLALPPILQQHDEWSDRLGHANFTITPMPYEIDVINAETVGKFRDDWDMARVNYTKHLVRTGENYGHTSNIYKMTETKWAETEKKWKTFYDDIVRQYSRSAPTSTSTSRSRSRGRDRGRSVSANVGGTMARPSADDVFAGMEWRRLENNLPSAVPPMLEALDAQGKFPRRGDEDIVGPMQRDAYMVRTRSVDRKGGRFWKTLADKVGMRK